jgi:glucosamine-6-phosphate deaminase
MTNTPIITATAEELGARVAEIISAGVREAAVEQRDFLLGCPTGRTPVPIFPALAALAAEGLDVSRIVIVLMDEYLIPSVDGYRVVSPEEPHSCVGYARRQIVAPLVAAGGKAPQLWCADPNDPADYDRRIEAAGGIDLFLLASGASDGHLAFNPPGSARDSGTRVIELPESTRRDNMSTFPTFGDLSAVPRFGVSVGVATIVDHTRKAVMLLTGADKRTAFARITTATGYDPDWPATAVAECPDHLIFADAEAALA